MKQNKIHVECEQHRRQLHMAWRCWVFIASQQISLMKSQKSLAIAIALESPPIT